MPPQKEYTDEEITYKLRPPINAIRIPEFPERPDLFDEVEWVPFIGVEDAKLAHRLWHLPDSIIGQALTGKTNPYPRPPDEDRNRHALASNIYESLMIDHILPTNESEWEANWQNEGLKQAQWSRQDIFGTDGDQDYAEDQQVLIEGHDVLTAAYWKVDKLRNELRSRGLDDSGRSAELRRRLNDDERRQKQRHCFLPRSNLSHWGIDRSNSKYAIQLTESNHLKPLDMYTWAISLSPYNPTYWVSRAYCHYQQAYFDLAIGDAYRAQLLCEILADARARNRQPGLYPRIWHAIEQHLLVDPRDQGTGELNPTVQKLREPNGINHFIPTLRKALQSIISLSLLGLQCWDDYKSSDNYLRQRLIMAFNDTQIFDQRRTLFGKLMEQHKESRKQCYRYPYERKAGYVRGDRKYPYDAGDKNRHEASFLDNLNNNLFENNESLPWKRCTIRSIEDEKTLSVFATRDIEKGEMIFAEEPSIRGHLIPNSLPKNWQNLMIDKKTKKKQLYRRPPADSESGLRCENCHRIVRNAEYSDQDIEEIKRGNHPEACRCILEGGKRVHLKFCLGIEPQGDTCSQIARKLYHHRACGKSWTWLHNAMRQGIYSYDDMYHFSHSNEEHGTVLSLLLREVFDITLMRRERSDDPNIMAHEIDELLVLEDFEDWHENWFPFTFAANIQVPFDILLQLGVDIFRDLTFDTWVIQTVLRKLLVNVIPWDLQWRSSFGPSRNHWKRLPRPEWQNTPSNEKRIKRYDPMFCDMYLFPGFSLFNHACRDSHNATWGYDQTIPNRVLIWATERIPEGTEIRIPYRYKKPKKRTARRLLGKECTCKRCTAKPQQLTTNSGHDDDSGSDSPVETEGEDEHDFGQTARKTAPPPQEETAQEETAQEETVGEGPSGSQKKRKTVSDQLASQSTRPAKMSRTEIPESTQNTQAEDAGKAPGTNIGGSSGEGKLVL
ncbi:hypothetical protein MW887_007327 [Aspergillus wentii]|nr:hypothetical protein MW887_007327 [Aspergillus wentii]